MLKAIDQQAQLSLQTTIETWQSAAWIQWSKRKNKQTNKPKIKTKQNNQKLDVFWASLATHITYSTRQNSDTGLCAAQETTDWLEFETSSWQTPFLNQTKNTNQQGR